MVTAIFLPLSVLAIVAGGLISAFSARHPSRPAAWASAYLVLVVGIIQLGLIAAWQRLGQPEVAVVLVGLLAYNLGNSGVIIGTLLKMRLTYYRVLVNSGGSLIALAMVLLLMAVRKSLFSWMLVAFIILALVILVSMPIGLILSGKRHKIIEEGNSSL